MRRRAKKPARIQKINHLNQSSILLLLYAAPGCPARQDTIWKGQWAQDTIWKGQWAL